MNDTEFTGGFESAALAEVDEHSELAQTDQVDMLGGEDFSLDSSQKKVPAYLLMLLGLAAAAACALFGMRHIGVRPGQVRAADIKIDYDPIASATTTADTAAERSIMANLVADRATGQVPPEKVYKNPFVLADELRPAEVAEPIETRAPASLTEAERLALEQERLERERLARADRLFSELEINGILGGARPIVRISGETYRVGELVRDTFTVKAINARSVELEADGKVRELMMPDISQGTRRK